MGKGKKKQKFRAFTELNTINTSDEYKHAAAEVKSVDKPNGERVTIGKTSPDRSIREKKWPNQRQSNEMTPNRDFVAQEPPNNSPNVWNSGQRLFPQSSSQDVRVKNFRKTWSGQETSNLAKNSKFNKSFDQNRDSSILEGVQEDCTYNRSQVEETKRSNPNLEAINRSSSSDPWLMETWPDSDSSEKPELSFNESKTSDMYRKTNRYSDRYQNNERRSKQSDYQSNDGSFNSSNSVFSPNTSSQHRDSTGRDDSMNRSSEYSRSDRRSSGFNKEKRSQDWSDTRTSSQYKRNSDRYGEANTSWDSNWRDNSNRRSKSPYSPERDVEFSEFEKKLKSKTFTEYVKTIEQEADLFSMSKDYSLAHCVAEDMNMGSGIAVQFRRDFKKVPELLNQRQKQGGLAILEDGKRYIYYLVTKRISNGKPTYFTLFSSLKKMRTHIQENEVTKLAIPRIGCGLDRLEWDIVKQMIEFVFKNVDIMIVVCNFQKVEDSPPKYSPSKHRNCKLVNVTYPIEKIDEGTIILYLSTEDGQVSEEMKKLDDKFNFLHEFRTAAKRVGEVIRFSRNEQKYVLFGCIVRKKSTDLFDFVAFSDCIKSIVKENRKLLLNFVGIQAVDIKDQIINSQIVNILRNQMKSVDIYVCWPGKLEQHMPLTNRE